jgi:hypothetical protein
MPLHYRLDLKEHWVQTWMLCLHMHVCGKSHTPHAQATECAMVSIERTLTHEITTNNISRFGRSLDNVACSGCVGHEATTLNTKNTRIIADGKSRAPFAQETERAIGLTREALLIAVHPHCK